MDEQNQWRIEEASTYTHPLDVQLFSDRYLLALLGNVSRKIVLDIGCGNGYLIKRLSQIGAKARGLDFSLEMVKRGHLSGLSNLCVGSADHLPIMANMVDAAICSLTINNFSSTDITKRAFQEAFRVLKPKGIFIISLPNPHTLEAGTRFRWTNWEKHQTQENLVPGESFRREIMGNNGKVISIVNYYWPKKTLFNFAQRAGFILDNVIETTASEDEIKLYSKDLEPIFATVSFFLVISFIKPI